MEPSNGELPIETNIVASNEIDVNVFSQERSNSLSAKDIEAIQSVQSQRSQSFQTGVSPFVAQYFEKDNIYPKIKDIEISEELVEFHQIRKHFLIFTEAGKPVYTRYGDEMMIAPFFATMSAIIPKMQSLFWSNK